MRLSIILAVSKNNIIGNENKIPWYYPKDLQYFKEKTKENPILMGRKTADSIFQKYPNGLPNRTHFILTREKIIDKDKKNIFYRNSIKDIFTICRKNKKDILFIIGGKEIYNLIFNYYIYLIDTIYYTRILKNYEGDTEGPIIPWNNFYLESVSKENDLEFLVYKKKNESIKGEEQYLNLIRETLLSNSLSTFGYSMRWNLKEGFPLLTTKKMFLRGVLEELLWFLSGNTNSNVLKKKNVHIWDKNGSREYLDSIGLSKYEEGDLGPIYGFNFRYFGAKYKDYKTDYSGKGTDQIKYVLDLIRNHPKSRRILLSLWNPNQLNEVALPACHVLYQFKVEGDFLSCCLFQRSGDIGLGIPFNIASASILTHILAKLTTKKAGTLVHFLGDAHIYREHINILQEQITRKPFVFPKLRIEDRKQEKVEDFLVSDFHIDGYFSHDTLTMPLII